MKTESITIKELTAAYNWTTDNFTEVMIDQMADRTRQEVIDALKVMENLNEKNADRLNEFISNPEIDHNELWNAFERFAGTYDLIKKNFRILKEELA